MMKINNIVLGQSPRLARLFKQKSIEFPLLIASAVPASGFLLTAGLESELPRSRLTGTVVPFASDTALTSIGSKRHAGASSLQVRVADFTLMAAGWRLNSPNSVTVRIFQQHDIGIRVATDHAELAAVERPVKVNDLFHARRSTLSST
jgi:hypothetical protein